MTPEQMRDAARASYNRELAKQNLKVTMNSRLVASYNGGVFTVTKELISFLNAWNSDTIHLLDDYEVPIEINTDELLKICKQKYQEIMNEWHIQYEDQSRIRTAKNL